MDDLLKVFESIEGFWTALPPDWNLDADPVAIWKYFQVWAMISAGLSVLMLPSVILQFFIGSKSGSLRTLTGAAYVFGVVMWLFGAWWLSRSLVGLFVATRGGAYWLFVIVGYLAFAFPSLLFGKGLEDEPPTDAAPRREAGVPILIGLALAGITTLVAFGIAQGVLPLGRAGPDTAPATLTPGAPGHAWPTDALGWAGFGVLGAIIAMTGFYPTLRREVSFAGLALDLIAGVVGGVIAAFFVVAADVDMTPFVSGARDEFFFLPAPWIEFIARGLPACGGGLVLAGISCLVRTSVIRPHREP